MFAALFSSDCRICGFALENISRLPVCPRCLRAIHLIGGPACDVSGEVLASSSPESCFACAESRPHFDKAVAFGRYERELRELIHLLKYEQVIAAAKILGKILSQVMAKLPTASRSLLVILVPLHSPKRRQRGFNQVELIARAAQKTTNIAAQAELASNLLARQQVTRSQIGLTRPQREQDIRGAFGVAQANKVPGRDVMLVDDVLTTGRASECARILKKAGAKRVGVATLGRTPTAGATFEVEPEFEIAAHVS